MRKRLPIDGQPFDFAGPVSRVLCSGCPESPSFI
nr:MAG TPA: hypothetical protein [Caudoviricetes sp.]